MAKIGEPEKVNLSAEAVQTIVDKLQSPRDKVILDSGNFLWDRDNLNMNGRHDRTLMIYIIKNLIAISYYQTYWGIAEYNYRLKPVTDADGFVRITHEKTGETHPGSNQIMAGEHLRMLHQIQELAIGLEGKAREEVTNVLKAAVDRVGAFAENTVQAVQQGLR